MSFHNKSLTVFGIAILLASPAYGLSLPEVDQLATNEHPWIDTNLAESTLRVEQIKYQFSRNPAGEDPLFEDSKSADLTAPAIYVYPRVQPKPPELTAPTIYVYPYPHIGFQPGGGGIFVKDRHYDFRITGFLQVVASALDGTLDRGDRKEAAFIKRNRLDLNLKLYDDYQFFIQFDATPERTPLNTTEISLIEARFNWSLVQEYLQLRLGKLTTPFSAENLRSSRNLDTVERSIILNSLMRLPALDEQFGVMVHGRLCADKRFGYYMGIFNGNGRALDNFSDDNDSKEFQAKINYQFTKEFSAGLGVDYDNEERQTLSLADLTSNRYVGVGIDGERWGLEANARYAKGPLSINGEFMTFQFHDFNKELIGLHGGYGQVGYFLFGDSARGVQPLFRLEYAHLDADTGLDGDTLWAITSGLNWFVNSNMRLQFNQINQYFDGPSASAGFSGARRVPLFLFELQLKF